MYLTETEYLHIITADARGRPYRMRVETSAEEMDSRRYYQQLEAISEAVERSPAEPDGPIHVLLFFHGGLVSTDAAIEAAKESLGAMRSDMERERFYPIFVNWDTGIPSSWYDHLFRVRHGKENMLKAVSTAPFTLFSDFATALMRYPITGWEQFNETFREIFYPPTPREVPEGWGETVHLDDADVETSTSEKLSAVAVGFVPGLSRIVTTLFLDGIGRPSYSNMQRRARLLFLRDNDFERGIHLPTGVVSRLMETLRPIKNSRTSAEQREREREIRELQARLRDIRQTHNGHGSGGTGAATVEANCAQCASKEELIVNIRRLSDAYRVSARFRVTIVAHSMGSIVANELVRRNSDFFFDDIVFLGAACTIRDFARTTLTYVRDRPYTRFFNLCLHPLDELNDKYVFATLPFGSLLQWIDVYLTDQKSALDRTLGKWENVVAALPVTDFLTRDVRERIFVKGFGRSDEDPRDHDDFNKPYDKKGNPRFQYWRPGFWELDVSSPPTLP